MPVTIILFYDDPADGLPVTLILFYDDPADAVPVTIILFYDDPADNVPVTIILFMMIQPIILSNHISTQSIQVFEPLT